MPKGTYEEEKWEMRHRVPSSIDVGGGRREGSRHIIPQKKINADHFEVFGWGKEILLRVCSYIESAKPRYSLTVGSLTLMEWSHCMHVQGGGKCRAGSISRGLNFAVVLRTWLRCTARDEGPVDLRFGQVLEPFHFTPLARAPVTPCTGDAGPHAQPL